MTSVAEAIALLVLEEVWNAEVYPNTACGRLDYPSTNVGGNFFCQCNNLTSLQGAPKHVGGHFYCYDNEKKFTEEEVRAVCDVKGNVHV